MPLEPRVFDQNHESPGNSGNVIDLWGVEEDWSFGTDGALALQPEPVPAEDEIAVEQERAQPLRLATGLKAWVSSATVPRMATTEAPGFGVHARRRKREEARAKARRARRTAALVVVACGCLVA